MLRPFFGQCIFNIIFAAPAYPAFLLLSASSASLPLPFSCCGRNFFRFFIFWLLLFFYHTTPPIRPLAATLFAMGVYVFFPHTPPAESWGLVAAHWQLSGLQVASLHMRNALNAFVFLSTPSPSPFSATRLLPHCTASFFLYSLLGVEVKRTWREGWTGLGS